MRIGIEVEFWLVDGDGRLTPADEVISACDCVDEEFVDPLLEVKTTPCDSLSEVVAELTERVECVYDIARSRGEWLVPLGTPLSDGEVSPHRTPETNIQRAVLGEDFRHARHCAGTHIHFEQTSVTDQLRVLTALDPAIALVNTAPFYRGDRVAACARPHAYRRLCYGSLADQGQLWRYPESADEWRDRVERRFESFLEATRDGGIDREAVEAAFSPSDAVWSPVRLRDDLGTVEWRAPDTAPLADLCRLTADVCDIIETASTNGTRIGSAVDSSGSSLTLPPFETLRGHTDAAIQQGLSSQRVEQYLRALGFDTDEYRPLGSEIDNGGGIDDETARRLRLRAAKRLGSDMRMLQGKGQETDAPVSRAQRP